MNQACSLIGHGPPCLPSEVPRTPDADGKSLRCLGRLVSLDLTKNRLVIECDGSRLPVGTNRLWQFEGVLESTYEFLGELRVLDADANVVLLDARIWRCLNGIDFALYKTARQFNLDAMDEDAAGLQQVNDELEQIWPGS